MSSQILPVGGTVNIEVTRGGPPPEVQAQMALAASVAEELREGGYQLRFFAEDPGERPRIELHDADGNALSTLSTGEALELAAGGRTIGGLV